MYIFIAKNLKGNGYDAPTLKQGDIVECSILDNQSILVSDAVYQAKRRRDYEVIDGALGMAKWQNAADSLVIASEKPKKYRKDFLF